MTAFFSLFAGAALKGTAILGAAWLAAILLRQHSAAIRHTVWTTALAGVLALPFLSAALPALAIPRTAAWVVSSPALFQVTGAGVQRETVSAAARSGAPAASAKARWSPDWTLWTVALWAAGAIAVFVHMLTACLAVLSFRRSTRPWAYGELGGELSRGLGIRRRVEIVETHAGAMPMAFGILRSTIFMPADAAEWSDERRRAVLLHELAHVRRWDFATHLLARTALALYWWNPLAWIAWREFLKERERAADDLVLSAGTRASDYAAHLVDVARGMQSAPALGAAAVAMARRSQLESRVRAILDPRVDRNTQGRTPVLIAALAAIAMIAPLAAVRAQEQPAPGVTRDVESAIRSARSQKSFEILETSAKGAEQLRDFDSARKLLESALEIRAEIAGSQSPEYAAGLLKLADFESRQRQSKTAAERYREAADILGDRPQAAVALIHLGTAAIGAKDYATAIENFQHAQRIDPARSGPALMWMAVVRQLEQNMDEAGTLYQSALSAEAPGSRDAVITLKSYAHFLRATGQPEQASEMEARAAAAQQANAIPPPSDSSLRAGVYRMGRGITPPSLLQKIEPEYTDEARAAKLAGTVTVAAEIGIDGVAHNMQVLKGLGLGLDENAMAAIAAWRFKPGSKDGQPVTVAATIEVNWKLM